MEKYPEERQILIHPLPLVPVSKCMEGSSVLTDIIIGKFMYHLPFYRLTQQYRESGIGISESTMCGWYEMAVEKRKLLYNRKHPIKYTNNNGRNSFVRVCGHCRYMVVTVIPFSIGAVAVATVHHTMLSAYMASLQ